MQRLIQKKKSGEVNIFDIKDEIIVIGRDSNCTIQVDHSFVSRRHAEIKKSFNGCLLTDLNSTNGTLVNKLSVMEYTLKNKDIIKIGPDTFTFDDTSIDPVIISNDSPLAILAKVGKAVNNVTDIDDLMRLVLNMIFSLINADRGVILLNDKKSKNLITRMTHRKPGILDDITISKTVIDMVISQKLALIVSDIKSDKRLKDQESIIASGIKSVMAVPMLIKNEIIGIIQVDSLKGESNFHKRDLDLLCSFSDYMAMGIEQARLNDQIQKETRLRTNLERFHSPEVVNHIISNIEEGKDVDFNVEESFTTILFADICGFTPMAENMEPVEVAKLLRSFFSLMTDIIFENKGTLDKYIGDAVMALFGAPYKYEFHADCALKTALEMQKGVDKFFGVAGLKVKIGINTGKVVAGNIGSQKRMEYTVLGDTVNIASRLCSMCKPGGILIGSNTKENLSEPFDLKEMGYTNIKGKKEKVNVYEII